MDVINRLPIELQNKVFYYLQEPCAEIFRKSNFCDYDVLKPLFRNLRYVGFHPSKYGSQIDNDFYEYWEPYLIYDI
jgi:hypothetical protein